MDFAGTPEEKKKKITTVTPRPHHDSDAWKSFDYVKHLNSQFPQPPPNK
jgi:hypothetical protein